MVFPVAETDFDAPPADAAPSAPLSDYVGSYRNDFIGVVECDVSPLPPVNFSFPVST
jgi:hypothetical protein